MAATRSRIEKARWIKQTLRPSGSVAKLRMPEPCESRLSSRTSTVHLYFGTCLDSIVSQRKAERRNRADDGGSTDGSLDNRSELRCADFLLIAESDDGQSTPSTRDRAFKR